MRRAVTILLVSLVVAGAPASVAAAQVAPGFEGASLASSPIDPAGPPRLPAERCADRRYPACRRLRFFYGPIVVTPGANYQMVGPMMIPKPHYDGYMIRFRPDLVRSDGSHPLVDHVMLHHATWFAPPVTPGQLGQFIAAGEEKTIFQAPHGYGVMVRGTDPWYSMYMIHSQIPTIDKVWLEYDVDYVPKAAAEAAGIRRLLPIWLDVGIKTDHPFYPVFNALRGYGHVNRSTGLRECAYPRERCAPTDPYGEPQHGNGKGYDYPITAPLDGTLVLASGHLHPGGLRDEVSVVRGGRTRRIANLRAVYYDPKGDVSPDFSMTVTPPNWRVRVRPGDVLRLNAVYDTTRASWYEPMGIALAYLAPGDRSGVDPFSTVRVRRTIRHRVRSGRCRRRRGRCPSRWRTRRVYRRVPAPIPMDARVTHGHLPENGHYGGNDVVPLPTRYGKPTSRITIADFRYSPGDLSSAATDGIPLVKENSRLTFVNADAGGEIWHTITTCAEPCTGTAGVGYPIADDPGSRIDSLELGLGPSGLGYNPGPTKPTFVINPKADGLVPGRVYTFFCRIHPFMRGAFKVVK